MHLNLLRMLTMGIISLIFLCRVRLYLNYRLTLSVCGVISRS